MKPMNFRERFFDRALRTCDECAKHLTADEKEFIGRVRVVEPNALETGEYNQLIWIAKRVGDIRDTQQREVREQKARAELRALARSEGKKTITKGAPNFRYKEKRNFATA